MDQKQDESDKDYLMIRYLSDNVVVPDHRKANPGDKEVDEDEDGAACDDMYNYNQNLSKDKTNCSSDVDDAPPFILERSKSSLMMLRRHSSSLRKKQLLENTYRMEPKSQQFFVWWKVRNAINKLLSPVFDHFRYDAKIAPTLCKTIAGKCVNLVKRRFDYPRYRFVCHVTLVQLRQQGVIISDRSLWNTAVDNYAVCAFKNKSAVCVITFHAIYME